MVAPGGACVLALGGGHAWLLWGGHAWLLPGVYGGVCMRGTRQDTVNEQAVRILLECILVWYAILVPSLIYRDSGSTFFAVSLFACLLVF